MHNGEGSDGDEHRYRDDEDARVDLESECVRMLSVVKLYTLPWRRMVNARVEGTREEHARLVRAGETCYALVDAIRAQKCDDEDENPGASDDDWRARVLSVLVRDGDCDVVRSVVESIPHTDPNADEYTDYTRDQFEVWRCMAHVTSELGLNHPTLYTM
jgi:hypothetical protein